MKKIILAIVLVLTIGFGASAQRDGFFTSGNNNDMNRAGEMPMLPGGGVGANGTDQPATTPLGSGLLVLTALGAGYAIKKRRV